MDLELIVIPQLALVVIALVELYKIKTDDSFKLILFGTIVGIILTGGAYYTSLRIPNETLLYHLFSGLWLGVSASGGRDLIVRTFRKIQGTQEATTVSVVEAKEYKVHEEAEDENTSENSEFEQESEEEINDYK